ncbi:hypothetical protein ACROYT_G022213 [Oculina patagonica]
MKIAAVLIFTSALVVSTECLERQDKCLPGEKHKEAPSAEESMSACQAYKSDSCCTSDFTKQLASYPIRKIGNFSWTPCNKTLSRKCQAFMVDVECFYRCSHNAIFWKNPQYQSAMLKAPICASFCDGWFEACKEDLTCAKNWATGFNWTSGINTCKQPCGNFSDYYTSGKDLCESIWGTTFVYKETDCLQLNLTDAKSNPNDKLVEKLFGEKGTKPKNGLSALTVDLFLVYFVAVLSVLLC